MKKFVGDGDTLHISGMLASFFGQGGHFLESTGDSNFSSPKVNDYVIRTIFGLLNLCIFHSCFLSKKLFQNIWREIGGTADLPPLSERHCRHVDAEVLVVV
jgi:hypothetical protein